MAEYIDSDVQDELQAMLGSAKVPPFGANRTISKDLASQCYNQFTRTNIQFFVHVFY